MDLYAQKALLGEQHYLAKARKPRRTLSDRTLHREFSARDLAHLAANRRRAACAQEDVAFSAGDFRTPSPLRPQDYILLDLALDQDLAPAAPKSLKCAACGLIGTTPKFSIGQARKGPKARCVACVCAAERTLRAKRRLQRLQRQNVAAKTPKESKTCHTKIAVGATLAVAVWLPARPA